MFAFINDRITGAVLRAEACANRHTGLLNAGLGVLVFLAANQAFADVAGAMTSMGTGMSGWAQAGGSAAAVFCGARVAMGHYMATIPMGVGVVTMAQPNDVTGWLGL